MAIADQYFVIIQNLNGGVYTFILVLLIWFNFQYPGSCLRSLVNGLVELRLE